MEKITIRQAVPTDASFIAKVVCTAIASEEGLRSYCGEEYEKVITQIAEAQGTQYSWENALIAEVDGKPAGGIVAYDGAQLHPLRSKTWDIIESQTGKRPCIADETQAGECYIDSLAVMPEYRKRGLAKTLIIALAKKVADMGIDYVGLLVDEDNEKGQALYKSVGFTYVNDSEFLGHKMYHLQLKSKKSV